MPPPIDVCIRGAGVVGRSLALLLARERLHVGLVEQPAHPGAFADVRAYALNAASRHLLQEVRAWPDDRHAEPVLGMEVHGDDGGAVNFRPRAADGAPLAWIADVPALQQRLGEALRYQPLVRMLEAPVAAPLTVVCEGKASSTRAEFGVEFDSIPYGQQAIAARLVGEKPHEGVARQWFCGGGDILALLPLPPAERALPGNALALVWSVAEARASRLLALAPDDFAARVESMTHAVTGKLSLVSERPAWPLHRALARRWCGPGWALAGDAAHTVHPLAGQGLNLGLADAWELTRVLHQRVYWRSVGDVRLLRAYERARKADVIAMGAATDGLQQLFAHPSPPWGMLRNWGMKGFDLSGPLKDWVARRAAGGL
jgi:2-polyprenyl-6-methoxyphenol hydroxylase-like FAD-dependent oxidoreductase